MKIIKWLIFPSFLFLFSCERAIEFSPRNSDPKLVVEATIENGQYPKVFLTHSLNFFSNISAQQLAGSFVRNAVVKISNGIKTHTLKEYEVAVGGGFFLYYYSVDSANLVSAFIGEEGEAYSLVIQADQKEYTAGTSIPHLTKTIDSLYYQGNVDEKDSTKVVLYGQFKDPPGFGNYSRYFTQTNDGPFLPGLNSVFDDQVIDGKTYKVQIDQGVDRNSSINFDEYAFFRKGDKITVKFCNIDKAVFDFWRTLEYSYSSIGNPFSSPTKVLGNISNGALGYFGGYAVQYASIFIPE